MHHDSNSSSVLFRTLGELIQHSFVIEGIGVLGLKRGAKLNTRDRTAVLCTKSEEKLTNSYLKSGTAFFICNRLDLHLLEGYYDSYNSDMEY